MNRDDRRSSMLVLLRRIREWNGDADAFAGIVRDALDVPDARAPLTRILTHEFEMGPVFVGLWARGAIAPTPGAQKRALETIRRHFEAEKKLFIV